MMRGNNVVSMVGSMSAEGKQRVNELVFRYDIKPTLRKNDRRTTITLSRVCMTVPMYPLQARAALKDIIRPIRPCLEPIHCLLQVSVCIGYMTRKVGPCVELLSLACNVIQGSVIGDKRDTLGSLKKYVTAARESSKISEDKTIEYLVKCKLGDSPLNWGEKEPTLSALLGAGNDTQTVRDVAVLLTPVLASLIPPPSWYKWVVGFQSPA